MYREKASAITSKQPRQGCFFQFLTFNQLKETYGDFFFLVLFKFVNVLLSHTGVKAAVPDSPGAIPGSRTLRLVRPFFSVQFVLHSILKVMK